MNFCHLHELNSFCFLKESLNYTFTMLKLKILVCTFPLSPGTLIFSRATISGLKYCSTFVGTERVGILGSFKSHPATIELKPHEIKKTTTSSFMIAIFHDDLNLKFQRLFWNKCFCDFYFESFRFLIKKITSRKVSHKFTAFLYQRVKPNWCQNTDGLSFIQFYHPIFYLIYSNTIIQFGK